MSIAPFFRRRNIRVGRFRFLASIVVLGVVTFAFVVPTPVAQAATDVVTNCSGSASVANSLPYEVANASTGDVITFNLSPSCSLITLTSTIDITNNLNIEGPGATALAVSGGGSVEDFLVSPGAIASISGLTIENGSSSNGGGILNLSTLTLTNVTVKSSTATNGAGGGISNTNNGTLTVIDSTVADNNATSSNSSGGGIFNDGTADITDSTVVGNSSAGSGGGILSVVSLTVTNTSVSDNNATSSNSNGGGIFNVGTAVITGSTVSGNTANQGGGIYSPTTLTVSGSTVSGNTAHGSGGGIESIGLATVTASTVSDNMASEGGGIYSPATLTVTDSTVSGNATSAGDGGGLLNLGTLTVTGSTVSGNTTDDGGGGGVANDGGNTTIANSTVSGNIAASGYVASGIYNGGDDLTVTNSTVADNDQVAGSIGGGGIFSNGANATLEATIVVENNDEGDCRLFPGVDEGYNIDDDGTCDLTAAGSISDSTTVDGHLGPLANNGGPTQTMALLAGSPAIDQVPSGDCPATDQRGAPRTPPCDIGAFDTDGIPQAITFTSTSPAGAIEGGPTYTVAATGGGSGNPVTFAADPSAASVCSVSGTTVTFIGGGTCLIDANQVGNANYQAAPQVQQSFAVTSSAPPPPPPPPPPSPPTVTENCPTSAVVGTNYSCLITTTGNPGPTITITGLSPGLSEFLGSYDTAWIVGIPTSAGPDPITITVTNHSGTVTQSFTLTIGADPTFTTAASATIPAKKHSNLAVAATGIPGPVVTASGLPSWLTLSSSRGKGRNGTRSGTTTLSARHPVPGTYTFTLIATNSVGVTNQTFRLTVTG